MDLATDSTVDSAPVQQFLTQHPTYRVPLAVLSLFPGAVPIDVLTALSATPDAPEPLRGWTGQQWAQTLEQAAEAGLLRRIGPVLYVVAPLVTEALAAVRSELLAQGLPGLEAAFVTAYARRAHSLNTLPEAALPDALRLWAPQQPNLVRALRLAQAQQRWREVADLLTALIKVQPPGSPLAETETLLAELEAQLRSASDWRQVAAAQEALLKARMELARQQGQREAEWAAAEQLKTLLENRGDLAGLAAALQRLGELAARHDLAQAEQHYRRSLYLRCRLGHLAEQCELAVRLGQIAQQQGLLQEATAWLSQGLSVAERLGNLHLLSQLLLASGDVARAWGKPDRAEVFFRRCLALQEQMSDLAGQAQTQERLGLLALDRRRCDEAGQWFRAQRQTAVRLGHKAHEAQALMHLAHVAMCHHRLNDAEECYRRSLDLCVRLGDEVGQAHCLCGLGAVAYQRGRLTEAEQWFEQSLALAERTNDEPLQIRLHHNLGNAALLHKELARAEQAYGLALKIAQRSNLTAEQASALYSLGRLAEEQKDLAHAAQHYSNSLALAVQAQDIPAQAKTLQCLAELAARQKRLDEAEGFYRRALGLLQTLDDQRGCAEVWLRLARLSERRGDFPEAQARCEQSLALRQQMADLTGMVRTLDQFCALPGVKPDQVDPWYDQLLSLAEQTGNAHIRCVAVHKRGDWAAKRGLWAEAQRWYRRGLSLEQQAGRRPDQALLLAKLARAAVALNQPVEAEALCRRAVELGVLSAAERWLAPEDMVGLGDLLRDRGHADEALLWYQPCLKTTKDPAARLRALCGLARVALIQGDAQQAQHWLDQADEAARGPATESAQATLALHRGLLQQHQGDLRKAAQQLNRALRLADPATEPANCAQAHWALGCIHQAQGRPDQAQEHFAQAEALFRQCAQPDRADQARQAAQRLQPRSALG